MKAFFVTIPHSGEKVPAEATWLHGLPEPILMCDVDRFVDKLYSSALKTVGCPAVIADIHRYVIDLNRLPDDIDSDSVEGAKLPSGKFPRGLHWIYTTHRQTLMPKPISMQFHNELVAKYFEPFHRKVRAQYESFRAGGAVKIYHVDAHSMPSMGTSEHADPGERRADIVVSDCEGKSCETRYKDLVIGAYESAGFKVAYNWPYVGGRVTETYGRPQDGHHAIQVELNRALYMNEETKRLNEKDAAKVSNQIASALSQIERDL
jgi:N-formylglutamate amidohydrolase